MSQTFVSSPPLPGLPERRDVSYTTSDGLRLYAADYGPKDAALTAVCMHGLTRNHKDFEPMIARLSLPMRYISVDVRGRGLSARAPAGTYQPAVYAQDMARLIEELKLDRLVLIGTSMGGLMAMIMAKTMPEKIRGIVLNDVGPVLNPDGLKRIAGYAGGGERFTSWEAAANVIRNTQAGVFPDYGEADWIAFARRTCAETEDGQIVFDYDPAIVQGMGDTSPDWKTNFAMWRLFGAMKKIPLLIMRGESSDVLSPATAARMNRRHPRSRLVNVPGRGHTPALDEPESIEAIEAFIRGLPR